MNDPDPTADPAFKVFGPAATGGRADVLCCLLTFVLSTAVLVYAMSSGAKLSLLVVLYAAVLVIPIGFCVMRRRDKGELTFATLLLMTTAVAGPIGALGCALVVLALWSRQPGPERLRHWYEYISGVVARGVTVRLYEELTCGRLPSDTKAAVPRFRPILRSASVEEQQRVLGVLGRRYHEEFRAVLREALRHRNGFIRAQAAAVATRLDFDEKTRLWSGSEPSSDPAAAPPREPGDREPAGVPIARN
jgi:hypothetical protein